MLKQFGSLTDKQREDRATIVTGACHAASFTEGAWHLSRLVGVREVVDQSGDLTFPTPGDGRLGERPMVQEGRGRTQRKHELRRQMDDDTARAKRAPSASTLDELDDHLAAGTCRVSRSVSAWNILDKAWCSYGMVPTRAARCCYLLYSKQSRERTWNQNNSTHCHDAAFEKMLDPIAGSPATVKSVVGIINLFLEVGPKWNNES